MRQSIGKEVSVTARKEARPATQAFVTEILPKTQIAVGDTTPRYSKRSHEATLLGLAPPIIERAPVAVAPKLTVPMPELVAPERDDRGLAAILVLGTLIAMFSIAFSAVPEAPLKVRTPSAQNVGASASSRTEPMQEQAKKGPSFGVAPESKVEQPLNSQIKPARARPRAERAARPVPASKSKPATKVEARKRAKLNLIDRTASPYPGARITE